jgi:ATP-dependent DNA helicase RecQ
MQHQGILKYVPSRRTPVITWKRNRVETNMLNFTDDIYTDRKQEYIERIGSMSEYVTRKTGCRSAILLEYFGEKQTKPCMHCDLCLEKDDTGLKRGEYKFISNMIEDVLSDSETSAEQIYMLPFEKSHIETVLHKMAQEEAIHVEEGKLVLNKKYNYDRN